MRILDQELCQVHRSKLVLDVYIWAAMLYTGVFISCHTFCSWSCVTKFLTVQNVCQRCLADVCYFCDKLRDNRSQEQHR